MYYLLVFLSRIVNKINKIITSLTRRWEPADIQYKNVISSTAYNMVTAPDESYYADQYWSIIYPHLTNMPPDPNILDLGCGQGRFTLKLAEAFPKGKIYACDISETAIEQLKAYAKKQSLNNINFCAESIDVIIQKFGSDSVDIIFFLEVSFFYPNWRKSLDNAIDALKPGGIIAASFRSQYFNALYLVRHKTMEHFETLIKHREGRIFGHSTVFTWQTDYEIKELLANEYGLELLDVRGIGVCSGIPGDPHDYICRPSLLTKEERQRLMDFELELGKTVPDAGRYLLAVARKSNL